MAHLKKDGTSGHLLKGSGGHLVNACAIACSECNTGTTPYQITATLSGITVCTGCYLDPYASFGKYVKHTVSIPASVTLTQYSACEWRYVATGAFTWQRYSDSACTSLYGSYADDITYVFALGGSGVAAFSIQETGSGPPGSIFSDTVTGLSDPLNCQTSLPSFANDNVSCGYLLAASGGTVTLAAV